MKLNSDDIWYDDGLSDIDTYEQRVRELESQGMTRSDAQAVADAELEST